MQPRGGTLALLLHQAVQQQRIEREGTSRSMRQDKTVAPSK
jgi:hypothetical protein